MHDASGSRDEEQPMIPDELTPRQQSEDPVANDPDASGAGAVSGVESDRAVTERTNRLTTGRELCSVLWTIVAVVRRWASRW